MESMINEELRKIGLTQGEAKVYLALLRVGSTTSGKIIKESDLASSKVYDVLTRLKKKGLISHVIKNNVKHYDATPPERLIDFLEEKKSDIEKSQNTIKELLPKLKNERKSAREENSIVTYTGIRGPKIVLKETIEAGKKGARLCGFGTDEDPYKDYLPADIEQHFRDQKKYKIKWDLLFTKGSWKSPSPLANIKYLPEGFNLPIRTMIYGDKVAIVDFNKPITTIVISKKEIVENYYKFFDFLWNIAKK